MTKPNIPKINPNVIIITTASVVGLFVVYKVLERLGIIQSSEEIKEAKELKKNLTNLESSNYWDFNKFLSTVPQGTLVLTQGGASAYADDIWNAKGVFNDDEDKVFAVFRAMKTQSQVASLAKRFNQKYSKDLYTFIRGFFNDEEMITVKKLLDAKPKYKI
jgi:hypothetical protein